MLLGDSFGDFVSYEKRGSVIKIKSDPQSVGFDWLPIFLFFGVLSISLVLLAQVVRLQVFEGAYFHSLSENNRTKNLVIHAPRGSIFDRNGVLIAGSDGAFRLEKCSLDGKCASHVLSREQGLAKEAGGLGEGELLEVDAQRFYPEGEAVSHVLGYVSEITDEEFKKDPSYSLGDRIGRSGIEQQYESILRGKDGKELVEVDALGSKERTLNVENSKGGKDLTLTIDAGLQKAALEALGGRKGAVVASVPSTGEILAMVSSPSFDNNVFTSLTMKLEERDKKVSQIFENTNLPMFNRAVSATYPPGSTFKIISSVAGLESGKITATTTIDDPGILEIGPYKFPNWKYLRDGGRQGILNVSDSLKVSNDIFFYQLGGTIGDTYLFDWAKKFGLGKKLGIDFPGEAKGLVPDETWRKINDRTWYLGDTYHVAIGQGDLLVTPLQINHWTSAISNDGKVCKPYLVKGLGTSSEGTGNCKDLGIKKETIDLVKKGLVAACSDGGTAYPLFNFQVPISNSQNPKKIQIACKTGTAEFGDPNLHQTHAWLTAYAPAEKPEIVVTALVEGGGEGSDVAAPVVKKVLEYWFSR